MQRIHGNKPLTNETIGLLEFTRSSGNLPHAGTEISFPHPTRVVQSATQANRHLVPACSSGSSTSSKHITWHITVCQTLPSVICDTQVDQWEDRPPHSNNLFDLRERGPINRIACRRVRRCWIGLCFILVPWIIIYHTKTIFASTVRVKEIRNFHMITCPITFDCLPWLNPLL
jgi:hypothetical protein